MRLKATPEDFVVEELIRLPLNADGPHAVYRLHKRDVTTLQVQEQIAAQLHIGKAHIAFPALKDKEAVATQYLSLTRAAPERIQGDDFVAERVGFASRALQPADLRGNAFTLVLRDLALEEAQRIGPRLRQMGEFGLPNFFDEQRFGSYSSAAGFIGRKILERDAEGALRIYLSEKMAGDPARVRVFKEFAHEHWGDWSALMEQAPKPSNFRSVLTYLKDHPAEYRKALNLIPHRLLTLYLSAYQSWLWNLIAAEYITRALVEYKFAAPSVRVASADLPIYLNLPEGLRHRFDRLHIPLPNHRAAFADADLERAALDVLAREQLTLNDFKARILKKAFAAKSSRALSLHPQAIQVSEPENDELARRRWKARVQFTLPPGSYATLVVKALAIAHGTPPSAPPADV